MANQHLLRAALDYGRHLGEAVDPKDEVHRVRAGQGLTGEMQAVIGFFALAIVGIFVVSKIDSQLSVSAANSGAQENYSAAANQTSGGFKDTIDIAVVVPLVVFAGLILGVIMRFV